MIIKFIDIQNFRKLKCCRINFSEKETLFVGANNSGKTSAMDALITFLSQKGKNDGTHDDNSNKNQKLSSRDFTLSNWGGINKFAESWLTDDSLRLGETISEWQVLCPSIDVWISVKVEEVEKVTHLIPTLKWSGGELGVRLIYQPKNKAEEQNIETLKSKYLLAYKAANELSQSSAESLSLWPTSLHDYLDRELGKYFEIKAYILDPSKISVDKRKPQVLTNDQTPLEFYPFRGLFKVSVIEAQRGFSDPNSSHSNSNKNSGNLSTQLNDYYSRHLNPTELPDEDDLEALQAIDAAKTSFDERLNESFKDALGEIKQLGYPGFNDPDIKLSSKVNPIESLDHEASVLFEIQKQNGEVKNSIFSLPEKYNGLGYKNLIFMIFKLISFRDQWMHKGKARKKRADSNIIIREPLHLVLIEEPEVHLHAQVQQIFIKKAYDVLRKDIPGSYATQLIVSSHSSYLAHEVNFEKLRYFKRKPAKCNKSVPYSNVVDLSQVFGDPNKRKIEERQTAEFVARYLKITHFDLFFANGIIMVEGAAERMLIPHFINTHFNLEKGLSSSYISILEVGGAHAHRLKPLIESLGLPTLVITDTDAVGSDKKKTRPLKGKGYCSGSNTLNKWFEWEGKTLDEVLKIPFKDKVKGKIRAAYQYAIPVVYSKSDKEENAIPYTFEDAIALTNIELIKRLPKTKGMLTKMKDALESESLDECCEKLFEALDNDKAEMALDLLFYAFPNDLKVPKYIEEGLEWLQSELENASNDYLPIESLSEEVHTNESN